MTAHDLTPLGDLAGTWTGEGLSIVAQPEAGGEDGWSLAVRRTHEGIVFADIGALAGGYGGVYYLHHVTDTASRLTLLIGPGTWLTLHTRPQTAAESNIVRLATLSEGHTILADGTSATMPGPPQFEAVSPRPIDLSSGRPIANERRRVPRIDDVPAGVPADILSDVNAILRRRVEDQTVLRTTKITIANRPGIEERLRDMPFTIRNPGLLRLHASFWVQTLADPARHGHELRQLQYSQTILIKRDGIGWPHISIATLVKQ